MSFNWYFFFRAKNGRYALKAATRRPAVHLPWYLRRDPQKYAAAALISRKPARLYNVKNKCAYKDYCAAAAASSSAAHGSFDGAGVSTSLRARASAACCRQSVVKMIPNKTTTRRAYPAATPV